MFKFIVLALIIIAITVGVFSYENEKIIIDTEKGKEMIEKSTDFVKENVEIK